MRSGFVSLVGRPNAGKSTLLNAILGEKVSIVSDKPQTTRSQVRGVLNRDGVQIVFVDTPGIHKPKTLLGERLNKTATETMGDVDVTCFVIDATKRYGKGDEFVLDKTRGATIAVINKTDIVKDDRLVEQLGVLGERELEAYFPVSAKTGDGVDALVEYLMAAMPEGPAYYPEDTVSDVADAVWVAELVREQLLAVTREELPHSIATRVTEIEWPRIRCEILVERESQKGMVIGKGGEVLKKVGSAVRPQLREGAFIELVVKVDRDWQRRPESLHRLGY